MSIIMEYDINLFLRQNNFVETCSAFCARIAHDNDVLKKRDSDCFEARADRESSSCLI